MKPKFINNIIAFYQKKRNCFAITNQAEVCGYCDLKEKCHKFAILKKNSVREEQFAPSQGGIKC